jgi:flagella basal body P-ring formation protein FlgA
MIRSALLILIAATVVWGAEPACTNVDGDQILGSDLASAMPAFRTIPASAHLAPAPLPGGMRIFSEPELETIGSRYGLRIPVLSSPICFRLAIAPVNRLLVQAAMQKSLQLPDARIELEEVSSEPAPAGTIEFPIAMLTHPATPDGPALWRGAVVSGSRRFNIWGRVRILAPTTRLIAAEDLRQGVPVQAGQIRTETVEAFPSFAKTATMTAESVAGLLPTRIISAGSEIRADYLARPLDVSRGDMVRVEVQLGRAHLVLTARAENNGRAGDMIAVRNPESSRVFQARVEGKDRVLVNAIGVGVD